MLKEASRFRSIWTPFGATWIKNMPVISASEVERGDLAFAYQGSHKSVPGLRRKKPKCGHVSIITASDTEGVLQQVHSTDVGIGGHVWNGTIRDNLVSQHTDPVAKKSGTQEPLIRIVRCNNSGLALGASKLAIHWDKFQSSYSQGRVSNAKYYEAQFHNKMRAPKDYVNRQQALFNEGGKYRAIKYAARRGGYLCYPSEQESQGGVFCSMFVVLCYQVAGMADLVNEAAVGDYNDRVSDKKMGPEDLEAMSEHLPLTALDMKKYTQYTQQLRSLDSYGLGVDVGIREHFKKDQIKRKKGVQYAPSLAYWNFDREKSLESVSWPSYITSGMCVDSKLIYPTGLFECLNLDKDGWQDMGYMIGAKKYDESKADKLDRIGNQEQNALAALKAEFFDSK